MKLRWAALVVVLALSALMPRGAHPQTGTQPPGTPRTGSIKGSVGQNFPNPFNPSTRFQFSFGDATSCAGERHRVSIRIMNMLAQTIAYPVIEGGTSTVGGNTPISNIELPCGSYTAYWNGKYLNTGQDAASNVYLYRVEVDGRVVATGRMFLGK